MRLPSGAQSTIPTANRDRRTDTSPVTAEGVMWQTIIHGVFILSALGIAYTDRIMLGSPASKPAKH